jgi:hypothetical protein
MKDWLKSYLLEKSVEALGASRTESEEHSPGTGRLKWPEVEQRKYERVPIHFPVIYQIGNETIRGTTVNVSNEGIMVESHLPSKGLLEIFDILGEKEGFHLEIRCIHEGQTYLRDVEIKHLHLDSSGKGPCRFRVGFWLPLVHVTKSTAKQKA